MAEEEAKMDADSVGSIGETEEVEKCDMVGEIEMEDVPPSEAEGSGDWELGIEAEGTGDIKGVREGELEDCVGMELGDFEGDGETDMLGVWETEEYNAAISRAARSPEARAPCVVAI